MSMQFFQQMDPDQTSSNGASVNKPKKRKCLYTSSTPTENDTNELPSPNKHLSTKKKRVKNHGIINENDHNHSSKSSAMIVAASPNNMPVVNAHTLNNHTITDDSVEFNSTSVCTNILAALQNNNEVRVLAQENVARTSKSNRIRRHKTLQLEWIMVIRVNIVIIFT